MPVVLNRFNDPTLRVPRLTIEQMSDTEAAAAAGLDLGDLVTVQLTPPSGDAISKDVRVWGMRHSVTGIGRSWNVQLDLVDAEQDGNVGIWDQTESVYDTAVYGY